MTDEQERWLQAARPDTAADDGWTASAQGRRALARIQAATTARPARPRLRWSLAGSLGLAGAAAAALVIANTGGAPRQPHTTAGGPLAVRQRPAQFALAAFDDCGAMLAGLRSHTAAHVTAYGLGMPYAYGMALDSNVPVTTVTGGVATVPSAAPGPLTGAAAPQHSTTNDQESDVDEPDAVKTDGRRIVSLSGGVLRVIDAASRRVTGTLDLNLYAGADGAQLLMAGNRVLVILGSYGYPVYAGGPFPMPRYGIDMPYVPTGGEAGYVLVDIAHAPTIVATMQTQGRPVDARLVGSTVRFVVASAPTFAFPDAGPGRSDAQRLRLNRDTVRHAPLSAWLPRYTIIDSGGSRTESVPCQDVRHPDDYTGTSLTTVYTVDLTRGLGDLSPTTVAADGAVVYSTTSNLYVTSSGTHATTLLHRFDITAAGRPDYLGTATVPGVLLDSYSMSDYAGHLRVVTTTVDAQGHTSTALYELDDATLRTVGHVGGLGRNEQVQAVRFLGDLGYVVTFRQVDPLYVLDLRNPSAPRVAAALTAPGYSTYLHPVGTGRLLGVGAALDANEPTALKLALLDVSHSAHPRLLDQIVRTDVWGGGQLDPHAFLYWPDSHIAVVPAQATNGTSRPGALVVRVDADRLHVLGMIHNPAQLAGDSGISRALVVGNTLWTMSQDGLAVRDLSSLHQLGWIPFG